MAVIHFISVLSVDFSFQEHGKQQKIFVQHSVMNTVLFSFVSREEKKFIITLGPIESQPTILYMLRNTW